MVRVCVLTSSYPLHAHDMSGWFVQEQCRRLVEKEGVEMTVLAPGYAGTPGYERHGRLDVRRVAYFFPPNLQRLTYGSGVLSNLKSRPTAWLNLVPFLVAFCVKTIRYGRRADIVHAHWGPMGVLAILTRWFHHRPVVLSVRGSDILGAGGVVRKLTAWAVRRSDGVSANTPVSHRKACELRGERGPCHYIPNGLVLPDMEALSTIRAQHAQEGVRFVSVGRLVRERRYDLLIRATGRIRRPGEGVTLTLVGDGPERAALERLVGELGLSACVHFAGRVSRGHVTRFLAEADVYVSATETDNFANAVLEGAAHALPVVATRVGFPAEVVVDGETGYLVGPGDEDGLCEAMRKLVEDPAGRREAGMQMRRRVEELGLTWDACAARTMVLYREVLTRTGRTN